MIKKYILILMTSVLTFSSCLKENPPYVYDELYNSDEGIEMAMNGIYAGFTDSQYLKLDFVHIVNLASGISRSSSATDRTTINVLNMPTNHNYVENLWLASYKMIERTNTFITNVSKKEELTALAKNQLAQAYFLRAFNYFNIVRIWGDAPLRLNPAIDESSTKGRALRKDIYTQIILDAQASEKLFIESENSFSQASRPSKYTVNMLLAKVYMTLATADIDNGDYTNPKPVNIIPLSIPSTTINKYVSVDGVDLNGSSDCWTNAFTEANKIYDSGKFSLAQNYEDLWYENGNNSLESIFEIQMNLQAGYEGKVWTPKGSYKGNEGWSRISFLPEIVKDALEGEYKDDPRYKSTFMTSYFYYGQTDENGDLIEEILFGDSRFDKNRTKKTGYPLCRKYAIKDFNQTTSISNQNMTLYRYADLLIMLAEISIEQPGLPGMLAPENYMSEVLDRARNSKYKNLQTGQYISGDGINPIMPAVVDIEFVMKEYRHELAGEGQDYFTERRRGRNWFVNHVVIPHNDFIRADGQKPYVVIVNEDLIWEAENDKNALSRAMYAPIPYSEITTNIHINANEQNDGY